MKEEIQNKLSEERTVLSNERTLLSYIQTSLAVFAFSFFIFRFSNENSYYIYTGIISTVLAIGFLVAGILQYRKRKRLIKKFKKHSIEIE